MKSYYVIMSSLLYFVLMLPACGSGNSSANEFKNEGHSLFEQYCAACHGKTGDLGLNEAPNLKMSELSKEEIIQLVRTGKEMMPPYQKVLTDQQIKQVAIYAITLR